MYIATCTLRKFQENNCPESEKNIVEFAVKEQLAKAQYAIEGLYQNLFTGFLGLILKPITLFARFNAFVCPATDYLGHKVVKSITKNGEERDNLTRGIFVNKDKNDKIIKENFSNIVQLLQL